MHVCFVNEYDSNKLKNISLTLLAVAHYTFSKKELGAHDCLQNFCSCSFKGELLQPSRKFAWLRLFSANLSHSKKTRFNP